MAKAFASAGDMADKKNSFTEVGEGLYAFKIFEHFFSRLDIAELGGDIEQVPFDNARHPVTHPFAHHDRAKARGNGVFGGMTHAAGHRYPGKDHGIAPLGA